MNGWKTSSTSQYKSLYEKIFYNHFEYPAEIEESLRPFDLQWFPPQWFQYGQLLKDSGRMGQVYLASCKIPYQKKVKRVMIREINLVMMRQQKDKLTLPKQVIGITAIKHKHSPYHQLGLVSMAHEYSLEQLIVQVDQWTFQKMHRVAIALTSAIRDLHQSGKVHPNLQPKNVLISNIYDNEDKFQLDLVDDWPCLPISQGYGRWPYISPEICYDNETMTQKSNIYSLGILLWQLVSGVIFPSSVPVDSNIYKLTALPKHMDPAYQDIVMRCLSKDPHDRPDAETLCEALIRVLMTDMTLRKLQQQGLLVKHATEVKNNQVKIAKYLAWCPENKQAIHDLMQGATIAKRVMLQLAISIDHHSYHHQQQEERRAPSPLKQVNKVQQQQEQDSCCEDENGHYVTTRKKQKYQKRPYHILASKNDLYYNGSPSDLTMQIGGFA